MLTIDRDERIRAGQAGTRPKFQTPTLPMMVAVDAIQSLQGLAAPFAMWADYRDICERGVSYSVPEIEPVAPTPMPEPLFLKVGADWDDTADQWTGLRDPLIEALTEDAPCAPVVLDLADGRSTWEVRTSMGSVSRIFRMKPARRGSTRRRWRARRQRSILDAQSDGANSDPVQPNRGTAGRPGMLRDEAGSRRAGD